jgi:hypothetical protein
MIEAKDFKRFVVPPTEELDKAIRDSMTHDLATESGKLCIKHIFDKLTATATDTCTYYLQHRVQPHK